MADVFLYPGQPNPSDVRLTNPLANVQHAAIVGSGGVVVSGAATILRHVRITGSGGVVVSGAATIVGTNVPAPALPIFIDPASLPYITTYQRPRQIQPPKSHDWRRWAA